MEYHSVVGTIVGTHRGAVSRIHRTINSKHNLNHTLCDIRFLYTINEQIPKGNQKDRDISSLWW